MKFDETDLKAIFAKAIDNLVEYHANAAEVAYGHPVDEETRAYLKDRAASFVPDNAKAMAMTLSTAPGAASIEEVFQRFATPQKAVEAIEGVREAIYNRTAVDKLPMGHPARFQMERFNIVINAFADHFRAMGPQP
jgi:hypothetical protein